MTAEGHAKVLDFGLARVVEPDSGTSTMNSPTFTMAATQAGVILGTAAYMSPEQAKGKVADKRSDVWSFGCVFYEMLTGKRLFEAEDVSETLAAVLRADPDWAALPAGLPPGVRTVVQRCLERDRKRRIPDMAVVRYLLDDAMAAPATPATSAPRSGRGRASWLVAAFAGGIALTAIGVWAIASLASDPEPPQLVRFGISPPFAQRLAPTASDRQVAVSPDGKYMVHVSGGGSAGGLLMLRRLDQLEATPIAGAIGRHPFFSYDGKWIGYFGGTDLRKVATAGGPSFPLCEVDGPPRGATWTADDTIIFATQLPNTGLQSVPAAGGTPKNITTPAQGEADHWYPSALPDGRGVFFTIVPTNLQIANAQIAVLNVETGDQKILVRGGSAADYVAPGYLVYAATNAVRAVKFDLERREVQGDPVTVLQDAGVVLSGAGQFAMSRSGVLVYVPSTSLGGTTGGGSDRTLVWMNRQGRAEPIKGVPPRAYFALRLSPDNTRVALDIRDQETDIWVWDLLRPNLTRLTFDPGADIFPVWTSDSRRIVFGSTRNGPTNLYAQNADGTGAVDRLTDVPFAQTAGMMLKDDSGLLITDTKAAQNADVSLVPLSSKGPITPVLNSPANERFPQISPDGRFIAYESDESTRFEIYVRPYPNVNGGKWPISTTGGTKPLWSPAGGELFYLDANSKLMAVPVQVSPVFKPGIPVELFEARNISSLASGRFFDVTKDGRRFVMIKELPPPPGAPATPAGPSFVVVVNWLQELKAAVGK
jgi:serine/threonine-protein kinase